MLDLGKAIMINLCKLFKLIRSYFILREDGGFDGNGKGAIVI